MNCQFLYPRRRRDTISHSSVAVQPSVICFVREVVNLSLMSVFCIMGPLSGTTYGPVVVILHFLITSKRHLKTVLFAQY